MRSAQDSTVDARLRAAAGIDNDAHAEEAEAQQQSVSALRSRFEHLQSSSSTPHRQQQPSSSIQSIDSSTAQPPPPPLLRTSSTFSTVSRISLPDIGSALTWADGGSMKTPGPPSASSSTAAAAPMSPPAVPAESAAAAPPPLPPTLPPRPLSSGQVPQAAAAATPRFPPPAIPGVKPVSPSASASISASASASQRPPSHPSSAAARSTSYTSSAQPSPSASPNPAGNSGSNGSLCAAVRTSPPPPPAAASTFSPSGTRLPAASSSGAISSSEPAMRAFPPPLLRSQHSKHNTGITTAANASLLPPPSQHQNHRREQAGMSPYSSSSATEDEDDDEEEGRDLFGASSDEDDEARYDHAPATPIPIDGATGPVSRHLSLARKPRGFRQKRRTLGAKALESVTATSTFLSHSLSTSARSPTNLAPLPPSIISLSPPGSASTSRPGSSGGTSGNDGGGSGVGLGLRGVASPMSSASSRFSAGIVEQFPDATHVNRRPPAFLPPRSAIAKSEFVDFDVCGSIVVTATHDGKVKVYHLPAAQANTAHSGQGISTSQHASHSSSSSTHHSHSSKYAGAEKVCEIEIRASKNGIEGAGPKEKLTAIAFRCAAPAPTHAAARKTMGRFVWVATKEGVLYEVDLSEARVCDSKMHLHSTAIVLLERVGDKMIALDDGGKISTWVAPAPAAPAAGDGEGSATPAPVPQVCVTMQTRPSTQRITLEKHACPLLLGDQLWICSGPHSSSHHLGGSSPSNGSGAGGGSPSNGGAGNGGSSSNGASAAGLRISIYNPPFVENRNFSAVSRPVSLPRGMASGADVGAVCTGATIPARPDVVFLGHESGHVTIWSKATFQCVGVQRLGRHSVVAMAGVVRFLWVGTRTGEICVYDPEDTQTSSPAPAAWRLLKKWGAHREPIFKLVVDRAAADVPQLQVGSAGEDGCVHFWDGTLQIDWLDKAVLCREAEFCTFRPLRLFITTFNIDAACPLDLQRGASSENVDFLETLITSATRGEHAADILVFGLQELIDLEKKSLTAKTLLVGKRRFADDMGAKISANYKDWHDALTRAVLIHAPPDRPYHVIASDSLVGLFTLVFVRASELPHIRDAATGVTKVGLGGRYGNKGAIATRMVIEDTSLSFVNCHLSAGQRAVKRRNQDVADILEDPDVFEQKVENTDAFVPGGDGRMILDHTLCFLSGDLNYRIDERRDTTIALIKSRQLDHLLALDQLRVQMRTNPTFRLRYFTEASPLSFDPTYKYDKHTHEWDSSAKQRIPAWCDRILWREQGADWSRSRARSRSTLKVSPTLPAWGDDDGGADASAAVSISSHLENVRGEDGPQTHPHPPPLSTSPIQQHQLLHEAQTHPHPPGGAGHVRVLAYRRWEPTISDHRPVSGLFEIQVRRVVRERKEEVLRQLRSEWREVEEEMVGIANSQWWL